MSAPSSRLAIIPALKHIIEEHGDVNAFDDPKTVINLLKDLSTAKPSELNLIRGSLMTNIVAELQTRAGKDPYEVLLPALIARFQEESAVTYEAAEWTINLWRSVLDLPGAPVFTEAQLRELEKGFNTSSLTQRNEPKSIGLLIENSIRDMPSMFRQSRSSLTQAMAIGDELAGDFETQVGIVSEHTYERVETVHEWIKITGANTQDFLERQWEQAHKAFSEIRDKFPNLVPGLLRGILFVIIPVLMIAVIVQPTPWGFILAALLLGGVTGMVAWWAGESVPAQQVPLIGTGFVLVFIAGVLPSVTSALVASVIGWFAGILIAVILVGGLVAFLRPSLYAIVSGGFVGLSIGLLGVIIQNPIISAVVGGLVINGIWLAQIRRKGGV